MRIPARVPAWFVVLPDCDATLGVAAALRPSAACTVPHISGRPWLMGRWNAGDLVQAQMAGGQVVVIGCCPITTTTLSTAAERVGALADLDRLATALPGSFHLMGTFAGEVRLQGGVSGLRRVFHTTVNQVPVAADRADVLADLAGAEVDEQRLATCLVYPCLPPLIEECLWQGVQTVRDDCYLVLGAHQPARVVRWWRAPEPVVALAEAAPLVAEALVTAVEARTQAGGTISCDLSGGLDSTPVCFLAVRGESRVIAVTQLSSDAGHDDARWAQRASGHLEGVEHLVLDHQQLPLMHENVGNLGARTDEPNAVIRDHASSTYLARLLAGRGSRLHIGGMGGDQVLQAPSSYLHSTAWAHPRIAASHLRGRRSVSGWPLAATLRELADRRSYRQWLSDAVDDLNSLPTPRGMPDLGWGPALRIPPWATPRAVDAARSLLQEKATSAWPLTTTRGQHACLEDLRVVGHLTRNLGAIMASAGLPLGAPFLDDRVVEACLAVRLHERTTPWRFKPLIVEALRDLVPAAVLRRTTKGDFRADWYAGLRSARAHLAGLLDDLVLARLGLVDADALRTVCLGLYPHIMPTLALDRTLACEAWLRSLNPAAVSNRIGVTQ